MTDNLGFLRLTKITIDKFTKKNNIQVETKVENLDDGNYELNISNKDFLISYQPDISSVSIYNRVYDGTYFKNHKLEIKKGVKVTEQLIEFLKDELNK